MGRPKFVNAWVHACMTMTIAAALMAGCSGGSVGGWPGAAVHTPSAIDEADLDPGAPVGIDLNQPLPPGEAAAGRRAAQTHDCQGCHMNMPVGPLWQPDDAPPIAVRAVQIINQDSYKGVATTAEQYLLESIVAPDVYLVPGFGAELMPTGYARLLNRQQTADLITYLMSLE